MMIKAVVLFSGGQDSCTVLECAIEAHGEAHVLALSVIYGQRHAVELDCAKAYASRAGVEHQIIDASFFGALVPSALTGEGSVSDDHPFIPGVPASFVPNRNAFFLTLGHAVAQARGADILYGGMCQTDYSGYPDCRQVFVEDMNETLNLGSNAKVRIVTPLMFLSKADTFTMACDLGVLSTIIENSHTCYEGDREHLRPWGYGCGECPACTLRAKGYFEFREAH
jgi:7-cyano-7-deazaguanine synthase